MRSAHRARKISLAISMGVIYPLMLLGDALEWPVGVQFALGVLALVVLVGVAVLLTDWHQWRADRAQLRRERAIRRRARRPA